MATANRKPTRSSVASPLYSSVSPEISVFDHKNRRTSVASQNR